VNFDLLFAGLRRLKQRPANLLSPPLKTSHQIPNKSAIEEQFVDGKFTLGNSKCEAYYEAYDEKYGTNIAG